MSCIKENNCKRFHTRSRENINPFTISVSTWESLRRILSILSSSSVFWILYWTALTWSEKRYSVRAILRYLFSAKRDAQWGLSTITISPGAISLVATACLPTSLPSFLICTELLQAGYRGFRLFSGMSRLWFSSGGRLGFCFTLTRDRFFEAASLSRLPLSITASIILISISNFCLRSNGILASSRARRAHLNASTASSCFFRLSRHLARRSSSL